MAIQIANVGSIVLSGAARKAARLGEGEQMRKIVMLTAGLSATFASVAALAEPPIGSRLGDRAEVRTNMTVRDQQIGAKRMGECLYNRKPRVAQATLDASSKVYAEAAAAKLHGNLTCVNAGFSNDMVDERVVSIPADILRGMLAEASLLRVRSEVDALRHLPLRPGNSRPWFAVTGRDVNVDEMGACLADANPAATAALIRSEPSSEREAVAFARLSGSLGKCLRVGTRLRAGRQALRAALAEGLYRRIHAPAPAVEVAKP